MKKQDHSDRERPVGSDALTTVERQVLALEDAGLSRPEIAERLGLKLSRVRDIASNYFDDGTDRWKDNARSGSIMLAMAINRTRGLERGAAA